MQGQGRCAVAALGRQHVRSCGGWLSRHGYSETFGLADLIRDMCHAGICGISGFTISQSQPFCCIAVKVHSGVSEHSAALIGTDTRVGVPRNTRGALGIRRSVSRSVPDFDQPLVGHRYSVHTDYQQRATRIGMPPAGRSVTRSRGSG